MLETGLSDWRSQVANRIIQEFQVQRTFRDCESRAPLIPQDVQTDTAIGVDVGVIDASGEVDLGRLEWVVGGKVDGEEEDTSGVWRVRLEYKLLVYDANNPIHQWYCVWEPHRGLHSDFW